MEERAAPSVAKGSRFCGRAPEGVPMNRSAALSTAQAKPWGFLDWMIEPLFPLRGQVHSARGYASLPCALFQFSLPTSGRSSVHPMRFIRILEPLVFWHGTQQFSKTWETTPDGREGSQNIFLRRNYGVYLIVYRNGQNATRSAGFIVGETHTFSRGREPAKVLEKQLDPTSNLL